MSQSLNHKSIILYFQLFRELVVQFPLLWPAKEGFIYISRKDKSSSNILYNDSEEYLSSGWHTRVYTSIRVVFSQYLYKITTLERMYLFAPIERVCLLSKYHQPENFVSFFGIFLSYVKVILYIPEYISRKMKASPNILYNDFREAFTFRYIFGCLSFLHICLL